MEKLVLLFLACCFHVASLRLLFTDKGQSLAFNAMTAILTTHSSCQHVTLLFTDGKKELEPVQAPRGATVLQVEAENQNNLNSTNSETRLSMAIDKVRLMGQLWHCPLLVLVSDDPTFLTAFAHLSLRRHALRWSMRILVLTRLPLSQLGGLHGLLSNRNAMLIRVQENNEVVSRVGVYVWQPYSSPSSPPLMVAVWTSNRSLTLAGHMSFFPDKISVFSTAPTLTVAIELLPHTTISWADDSDAYGGQRLEYTGYLDNIVRYLAKTMNFTYRYVVSAERTFGTRLRDGYWTGMIGMVVREEADFATGPFIVSLVRKEAADPSITFYHGNVRIVSGLTGLQVDPWGYLLPLAPLVWVATLLALLGMLAVQQLLRSCQPERMLDRGGWSPNTFNSVRIFLQQDIVFPVEWWWWERLVLGVWMLMTLVLVKSYSGNLMSLLAVRYVPQPFQTLRDILDHPSIAMIWQKYSRYEQYIRDVKSGPFREVAELEDEGRLKFRTHEGMKEGLNTLVRAGHHVLIDVDINLKSLIALDFSQKGRCDFYISRDGFLPLSSAMMTQKSNPLIYGFNKRLRTLTEQGLITYWMENVPNFTQCENVPKKMLVNSSIFLANIWQHHKAIQGLQEAAKNPGEGVLWTMTRHPSRPTSLSERNSFVCMWINGTSARTIARETGVSPSTVCRWINRWKQEGNVYNHIPASDIHYYKFRNLCLKRIMDLDERIVSSLYSMDFY